MIDEIKAMILKLCEDKDWDWRLHIETVVKRSKELAKLLGADEEVCELAAWLHDIKKLKGERELHHVHGSEEAGEILKSYDYPEEKIENVKHCVISHSSDPTYPPESVEAKIVASADALSHFDNFLSYVDHALVKRKIDPSEAKGVLLKKYASCWDKLMPEAKEIAQEKYDAIKLVIG